MTKRKYWYVCEIDECPICGAGSMTRYRVYEKPESYWQYRTAYDWCDV